MVQVLGVELYISLPSSPLDHISRIQPEDHKWLAIWLMNAGPGQTKPC